MGASDRVCGVSWGSMGGRHHLRSMAINSGLTIIEVSTATAVFLVICWGKWNLVPLFSSGKCGNLIIWPFIYLQWTLREVVELGLL